METIDPKDSKAQQEQARENQERKAGKKQGKNLNELDKKLDGPNRPST
ncbi:MAG TPA: spore protein [Bacilli bacterium]